MKQWVLIIITEWSSGLAALKQKNVNINNQHNSMTWTVCYDNVYQTYQSDKKDSKWYLKLSRKNLHRTQVKRHVDSSYLKSDSEKSYEVIKLFSIKKKLLWSKLDYTQQENYYSSDNSQEDFSQEEL